MSPAWYDQHEPNHRITVRREGNTILLHAGGAFDDASTTPMTLEEAAQLVIELRDAIRGPLAK